MELTELQVTVTCRGVHPSADALRLANLALAMDGVITVTIDKVLPVRRGPDRRLGAN